MVPEVNGKILLLVAASFLAGSVSAFPHHSDLLYDQEVLITLTGTVAEFEFENPHDLILLDVVGDQGKVQQWVVYGSAPAALARVGWSRETIKAGERLTVAGLPRKDGRKGMLHLRIVRSNGEILPAGEAERNYLKKFGNKLEKSTSRESER